MFRIHWYEPSLRRVEILFWPDKTLLRSSRRRLSAIHESVSLVSGGVRTQGGWDFSLHPQDFGQPFCPPRVRPWDVCVCVCVFGTWRLGKLSFSVRWGLSSDTLAEIEKERKKSQFTAIESNARICTWRCPQDSLVYLVFFPFLTISLCKSANSVYAFDLFF